MTGQVRDAAMIDTVFAYCAINNVEPSALEALTFKEVVGLLALVCMENPKWVWASHEVRQYYPVCHSDCHIARIKAFMRNDGEWYEGQGPNKEKYTDNVVVVDFADPVNRTRH